MQLDKCLTELWEKRIRLIYIDNLHRLYYFVAQIDKKKIALFQLPLTANAIDTKLESNNEHSKTMQLPRLSVSGFCQLQISFKPRQRL